MSWSRKSFDPAPSNADRRRTSRYRAASASPAVRSLHGTQKLKGKGLAGTTDLPRSQPVVTIAPQRRQATANKVFLPRPSACKGNESKLVDLVVLPDDSGSMYGSWGDQTGIRYATALSVVDLMQRMGGGRVGVVHWGTDAPREQVLPLTDVGKGRKALRRALQIPPSLGGNNFPAALDRAAEVLADSTPERIKLVVALTDGIEHLGPEVHSSLARLPQGSVHVLLVDRSHGCDDDLERQWRSLPLTFARLDILDTRQMSWQVAEFLAAAVGLTMPKLRSLPANKPAPRP